MNRIYQGRVSRAELLDSKDETISKPDWDGEGALWEHHTLFQDAVNYYIVALASLGTSPESKLTKLCGLLERVWASADKNGQRRTGMSNSLQRAWQLAEPPSLAEAVARFRDPLIRGGVSILEMELAGESLATDLGGEGSIQQDGNEYWPYFCQSGFKKGVAFPREAAQRAKEKAVKQVARLVWNEKAGSHVARIHGALKQFHFCNVAGAGAKLTEARAKKVLHDAFEILEREKVISEEQRCELEEKLDSDVPEISEYAGGSINKDALKLRFYGFLVFKHLLSGLEGLQILRGIYDEPEKKDLKRSGRELSEKERQAARLLSLGEDPIKLVRGHASIVFKAFTALPLWRCFKISNVLYERSDFTEELETGESHQITWKKFDIAAFKEALKVYNQFQQNVGNREKKLDGFALKLLIMDGERAMDAYADEDDVVLRGRLQKLWTESKGKPKPSSSESGEEAVVVRFKADARIDRLRKIVNDDLAEEYRLTDGRRTAYGLRRRTMKGWGEVKRRWHSIVKKGVLFSEVKRKELKAALDEMRGGEKREQIGSHRLFEEMIKDEAGWSIWREPDEAMQALILKNEWASDPLEAFREYCEIREAMEEVSARPLNFTPADARYSRRLFPFKESCSFGNDGGEYKHDANELAVTVPVAVKGEDGRFTVQRCRLAYSAPRLLRDGIRGEAGGYEQDWLQPMMQPFFGKSEMAANPQQLKDAAVQLMPDIDGDGERRVLLNFPLSLAVDQCWQKVYDARSSTAGLFAVRYNGKDKKKEKPLNGGIWESNIRTFWEGDAPRKRDVLQWPANEQKKLTWSQGDWWEKLSSFSVLAADLGTRHAASIAVVECGKARHGTSRFIGHAGANDWFGRYRSGAILRLPGENAVVLRQESPLDEDGLGKAFREELYGERGRSAMSSECEETFAAFAALDQCEMLADVSSANELRQRFSLPEQNDKLLVAIRRAQGWIAACISWHWKLTQPESDEQRQAALEALREQDRMADWKALADGTPEKLVELKDALHLQISTQRQRVQEQLLLLTHRIQPLRGRCWEWVSHPDKADCHLLRPTADGTGPAKVKLRGQRGLSMARIEQLSELRRRWQSLNQSLRREIGQKPLTASEMRNDPIPDPCPDVLRKLENIREQRVNQTAHLILAQALGLKLRMPQKSKESRAATDTHGEYEVAREPVDFIVLEDLSRYLSEQGRAKSENTRLMKWCHRAIMLKVKMLAEPFGIPVLETAAAYSSRFCSLTGMAGFRAVEVGWNDRHGYRWRELLKVDLAALDLEIAAAGQNKAKLETLQRRRLEVGSAKELFTALEKISRSENPGRTLLAPQPGGAIFVTAIPIDHPAPSPRRKHGGDASVLPMQADLNAAGNLAFRAVAHPACADIHHRLRTSRKKENVLAREARRFGKDEVKIILREGDSLPKERNTNFFYDPHRVAQFGRARLECDDETSHPYASGPGLWKAVNERANQWHRSQEINRARILKKESAVDEIPM